MAFDEGLTAFARKGCVTAHGTVSDFTAGLYKAANGLSGPSMDAAIREEYSKETADKLIGKGLYERVDDEPFIWGETDDPVALDIGFFLYADVIDWDEGTLKATSMPGYGEMREIFFSDSEYLSTEIRRPEFDAVIEGLSFEFGKIELLLPSTPLVLTSGFTAPQAERRGSPGRPPKWDWEGALAFIVTKAQHPDGLPTGAGAQARIEGMIADWFMREYQDSPAQSLVRQRAAKIMRLLEKPEKSETK